MIMRLERIADEIAGATMGLILAGLLYLVMGWAWPEMRVPVVIVFLVSWSFTSVHTIVLQQHGIVRTTSSGWRYIRRSERGRRAMSLRERIWGDMATILLGLVVSLFVAGLRERYGQRPDGLFSLFFSRYGRPLESLPRLLSTTTAEIS